MGRFLGALEKVPHDLSWLGSLSLVDFQEWFFDRSLTRHATSVNRTLIKLAKASMNERCRGLGSLPWLTARQIEFGMKLKF